MPLEIRLVPRFQLRTVDNNSLLLPAIEIAPTGSNVPHIYSIVCSVAGTPPYLAAQIQSAYPEFKSDQSFKVSAVQRLRQNPCNLDRPLPPSVNCTVEVKVEYFDSDAKGEPLQDKPKTAIASCLLFSASVSEPAPEPVQPKTPAQPKTPMQPDILVQETKQKTILQESEQLEKGKELEGSFPGWLALDFGTSNSTVTLFDPKVVFPPDSLPREQEQRLRRELAQWLERPPTKALPGTNASEWSVFIGDLYKNLGLKKSEKLTDFFLGESSANLLEAICQIELCLGTRTETFRRAASQKLNRIYHSAFRVPPMEWQNLIAVELDSSRRATEIPSELEIVNLNSPLKVKMGGLANQHRKEAIAQGSSNSGNQIKGKFHHSPKRYFGQERPPFEVTIDGKNGRVTVNDLLQGAWAHLIELTEKFRERNPGKFSDGRFNTAVVTYPAIAPPGVRSEIEELFVSLGISDVQNAYDEAVSVAIFFLWREFGGDLNIGIESFKTRCRPSGDSKWSQNLLVLDIGGGTTDLALISLTLEEIDPFEDGEDRGAGGRYYKLVPKLLGSSGHLQLGGELITLRIFLLLKVAIADALLTAATEKKLQSDRLETIPSELQERFLDKNDKYISGSLLKCLDRENPETDTVAYKDALDAAEKVLPTRWANSPASLQTFYALWEYAEEAKLKLGRESSSNSGSSSRSGASDRGFRLGEAEISELLAHNNVTFQTKDSGSPNVTISREQFERIVTPVIKEAIGIASGLMASRLPKVAPNSANNNGQNQTKSDPKNSEAKRQPIDWLILSGKTCNFPQVQRELYEEFSKPDSKFVWNPERITFVLEYTKLATSAGACYAEKLRRLIFDPKESKTLLRKGANQLQIDVKNLFYFLPCSFTLAGIGETQTIFEAGQELYQLQPEDKVAKVRSDWKGTQLTVAIYRKDFEGMTPQLWGSYDGQDLAKRLNLKDEEFREQIKVQFEIDHKLRFKLMFCQQGKPHYLIPAKVPSLDLKQALSKASLNLEAQGVISNGKLLGDIAVHVIESATVHKSDTHTVVFAGGDYSEELKVFRYGRTEDPETEQGTGLISEPLPEFPGQNGNQTFYFRPTNAQEWTRIGELGRPGGKTEFPCQYRASLDDKGILRIHAGEVPYWMRSGNPEEVFKQEGCVFQTELELQKNDMDEKRNPFSGKH
ncbi:MAG: molecular chaperone [Oscillatoria sp. SIO1A7]|nr:molecular chaperone [Oscillatoria sp. SIO1A7]